MSDIEKIAAFIAIAEKLKDTKRSASHTSSGKRETSAEHSWRLALLGSVMLPYYPDIEPYKALTMCLVHDLAEQITGDISAADLPEKHAKSNAELKAASELFSLLPDHLSQELMGIFREYEEAATATARFVKALDKAETIIQHNQGINPPGFDYEFNLRYGAEYFDSEGAMGELRAILDRDTRARMNPPAQ